MTDPHNPVPDLSQVPRRKVPQETVLYRIHRPEHGAVYFSRSGLGRFDPGSAGHADVGTCYFGMDEITAFVEVFGNLNPVPAHHVSAKGVSEVEITEPLNVADLTDRRLLGAVGPAPEASVGPGYEASQHWSEELHELGYHGVLYAARHAFTPRTLPMTRRGS